MENMDKGLTVPKWVLIFWPKIPQMLQNLSAQSVCTSPQVLDFTETRLDWASLIRSCYFFKKVCHVIRGTNYQLLHISNFDLLPKLVCLSLNLDRMIINPGKYKYIQFRRQKQSAVDHFG